MTPEELRRMIAKRLREARSRSGVTVEAAARTAGVSVDGLKAVECGCVFIHTIVLARLATLYGLTVEGLLDTRPEA